MGVFRVYVIVVMMMVVPMVVRMFMRVIVVMIVPMRVIMAVGMIHIQATLAGTIIVAQLTIRHVGPRSVRALTLDVVVMAFLNRAHLCLKPKHLGAVFAHNACGRRRI